MRKYFVSLPILLFFFSYPVYSQNDSTLFLRWQKTDEMIRDVKIDKDEAIDSIRNFVKAGVVFCKSAGIPFTNREDWVFPEAGWTKVEYRTNGKDYKDSTFDYFQGAEFHGHPAHDIFILDNDSDGIEDVTGKPVDAVAMVSGVIISTYTSWQPDNIMRSGNYVKLFDPGSQSIFYYSHLDSVFVHAGQIVNAGEKLANVGRTGRKAFRGMTHLHIAYYKIEDGYPRPVDIIEDLYSAEKKSINK